MQNSGSVYKEIFHFYNIKFNSNQEKQTARKFIKERLKKEFPQFDWSDSSNWDKLSVVDRNHFKTVTVREYFTVKSSSDEKTIKQKIDTEMKDKLIDARTRLKEHNEYATNLFRRFHDEDASDEENRRLYEEFITLLPNYTVTTRTPTYEEFLKGPHRLYDYQMSEINDCMMEDYYDDDPYKPTPVTEADIDHIALRSIIKYLESSLSISIDYEGIKDCLTTSNSFNMVYDRTDTVVECDETLKFFAARKRLEELDFVRKV